MLNILRDGDSMSMSYRINAFSAMSAMIGTLFLVLLIPGWGNAAPVFFSFSGSVSDVNGSVFTSGGAARTDSALRFLSRETSPSTHSPRTPCLPMRPGDSMLIRSKR